MAQSNKSMTQRMEEELTCAVCCELYSNPLLLQCSHTFCKKCIQDLVRNNDEVSRYGALSSSFKCPVCRRFISLKSIRGIDDLPENLSLANLVAVLKSNTGESPRLLQQQVPTLESATCEEHGGCVHGVVSLFCLDCSKPLCATCSVQCHGHRLKPVDNLWKDKWKNVLSLMTECGEKMSTVNERIQLLDDQLKGIDDQESSAKDELKAEVEILKSMLLSRLAQLNAEVHSEVHGLCHPVIQEREMCTNLLASLESTNICIQDLLRSQDGVKSVKKLVQLEGKLSHLLKNNVPKLLNRAIPVVTMPTWKLLRDNAETSIRTLIVRRTGPFPSESIARVGVSDTSCPMRTSPDEPNRRDDLSTDINMATHTTPHRGWSQSSTGQRNQSLSSGAKESFVTRSFVSQDVAERHKARPVRSLSLAKKMEGKSCKPTVASRFFPTSNGQGSSAFQTLGATAVSSTVGAAASSQASGDENRNMTFQNSVNYRVDSILNKLKKLEVCAENWDVHSTKKVKTKEDNGGYDVLGTTVPSSFRFGDSTAGAGGGPELFSGATPAVEDNPQTSVSQDKGALFKFGQATGSAVSGPNIWGENPLGTSNMSNANTAPGFSEVVGTRTLASRKPRHASKKGTVNHANPGNSKGFNFQMNLSSGVNMLGNQPTGEFRFGAQTPSTGSASLNTGFVFTPSGSVSFNPGTTSYGRSAASGENSTYTVWQNTVKTTPQSFQPGLKLSNFDFKHQVTPEVLTSITKPIPSCSETSMQMPTAGMLQFKPNTDVALETSNLLSQTPVLTQNPTDTQFQPEEKLQYIQHCQTASEKETVSPVTESALSAGDSCESEGVRDEQHGVVVIVEASKGDHTPTITDSQDQCKAEADVVQSIEVTSSSIEVASKSPISETVRDIVENRPDSNSKPGVEQVDHNSKSNMSEITGTMVEKTGSNSILNLAADRSRLKSDIDENSHSCPDPVNMEGRQCSDLDNREDRHSPVPNKSEGRHSPNPDNRESRQCLDPDGRESRHSPDPDKSEDRQCLDPDISVSSESDEQPFHDARSDPENSPQEVSTGHENIRRDPLEDDCSEENKMSVETASSVFINDDNFVGCDSPDSQNYQASNAVTDVAIATLPGNVQVKVTRDFTSPSKADKEVTHFSISNANIPQVLCSDRVTSSSTDKCHQFSNTVKFNSDQYNLITDLAAALSAGSVGAKISGSKGNSQLTQPNNVHTSITETNSVAPDTMNNMNISRFQFMSSSKGSLTSVDTTPSIATPIMSLTSMTSLNPLNSPCTTAFTSPPVCDNTPVSTDSTQNENASKNSNAMSNFSFGQFSSVFSTTSSPFGTYSTDRPFSFGQSTSFVSFSNAHQQPNIASDSTPLFSSGGKEKQSAASKLTFGFQDPSIARSGFQLGGIEKPSPSSKLTFGFQDPSCGGSGFQFCSSSGTVFGQSSPTFSASGSGRDDDDPDKLPGIKPFQFK